KLFSQKNNFAHSFEKGITVKFNIQDKKNSQKQFLIHALSNNSPQFISLNDDCKNTFVLNNYYPTSNEKAYISSIRKKDGKTFKTPLYTQFFPSNIPETNKTANHLTTNNNFYATESHYQLFSFNSINTDNILDEVIIKTNLEEERILKIRKERFGRVKFTTLQDSRLTLHEYINLYNLGFYSYRNVKTGTLDISRSNSIMYGGGGGGTLVYIDGVRVLSNSILLNFSMSVVDYVEFDKSSFTEGFTNGQGVIRIITDPMKFYYKTNRQTTTEIKFPITFSKAKKFYVPKYNSYTDNFYKKYGVVDWLPMNKID
ncbi:hypothetical protein, partial [uncultured Polaribacter sp.]|uniref:hypothetical protein n=1 Tax=uncultured Polaribacter sp. TaxID=174711 RepID=UPI0026383685